MRTPSSDRSADGKTEALFEALKDYSADEVVQAVSSEYEVSDVVSNAEAVSEGIKEHLRGNNFVREAISKQLERGELVEMNIDGFLSGLSSEQVDQLLVRLSEREML